MRRPGEELARAGLLTTPAPPVTTGRDRAGSSALVELHADEPGHAEDTGLLTADVETDHHGSHHEPPRLVPVPVTHDVLEAAAGLTAAHGLRAHDTGLRAAAAAEALRLLPA